MNKKMIITFISIAALVLTGFYILYFKELFLKKVSFKKETNQKSLIITQPLEIRVEKINKVQENTIDSSLKIGLQLIRETFKSCTTKPQEKKSLGLIRLNDFKKDLRLNRNSSLEEWQTFSYMENGKELRVRVENNLSYDKPHIKIYQFSLDDEGYPILKKEERLHNFKTVEEALDKKGLSGKEKKATSKGISFDDNYSGLKGSFVSINSKLSEMTITNNEDQILSCQSINSGLSCACL